MKTKKFLTQLIIFDLNFNRNKKLRYIKITNNNKISKIPYYYCKSMRSNTDFGGKIMAKWEHINNKRFYSHLCYSHYHPIPFGLCNLVPIPIRIPREGWVSRKSYCHIHL